MLPTIKKINSLLSRVEQSFLVFMVLLLLAFSFLQVILRNFFDSGINWADVFNRSLVIWVGFFGATLAAGEDKHLSLEVLTKFLPEKIIPILRWLVAIFTTAVCGALTYYAWFFYQDQIMFEADDFLFPGFPKAYITIIFPLGFALLTLRYTLRILITTAELPQAFHSQQSLSTSTHTS